MTRKTVEDIRLHPSRERWVLRQAVEKTGLKFNVYQKLDAANVYFDIVLTLPTGKKAAIHTYTRRDHLLTSPTNLRARTNRIQKAQELGVPLLELWAGPVNVLWAHIEFWLNNINTHPTRLAPPKCPYVREKRVRNKEKLGMRH